MKKLTLLEEAFIEEKKLQLENRAKKLKKKLSPANILKVLLPDYEPQPKQLKFHNSTAYEKGLKGGYGSGKTIALCAEAILLAYINRPLSIIISSPTEEAISHTTYVTLKNLLKQNNIGYNWLETKGHFEILFGDKPEECGNIYLIGQVFFKGPNVAAVGFDEPFSQRRETYENLIARVRHPKAEQLEVFWAGTPEPTKMEWGVEYFEKDHNSPLLFSITLPTRENKYLPKSFYDALQKKYDSKMQEVYLEGKYMLLGANRVYHTFDRDKNILTNEKCFKNHELILSFDFNVDPMTAVLIAVDKSKSVPVAYQIKEFSISSSNTKELCVAVIAYLESNVDCRSSNIEQRRSIIITGDATGKKRGTRSYLSDYEIIRDEFTKANITFYFNVPNENPPVRDRVNYVNKLFEQNLFYISEDCVKSIRDRELVTWKQSGEGFAIDKGKKDLTHLSDAADYGLFNNQLLLSAVGYKNNIYVEYRY